MHSSASDRIKPAFSVWDAVFLLFLTCLMGLVLHLGHLAYTEGVRLDHAMANGRIWADWLQHAHANRFSRDFDPEACSGHVVEHALAHGESRPESAGKTPHRGPEHWEACFLSLIDPGGAISRLMNPYTLKPIHYVESCRPPNTDSAGAIQLEKVTGTAVAEASPLSYHDPIDRPVTIRVSVCDAAGYPQRVAQVLF